MEAPLGPGLKLHATRAGRGGLLLLLSLGTLAACSRAQPVVRPAAGTHPPPTPVAAIDAGYEAHRVDGLGQRRFSPERYWDLLSSVLRSGGERFQVEQIGRSIEGRPLRRIDFGSGEIPVLIWSQMHGNESTASRALVDVFHYLVTSPDDPLVQRIESRLHLVVVPVVNPDGAARFVRHNAIGVDINRDARRLATPEARALKRVRDELDARWGFNMHDQNVRTRLGNSSRDVLIALLAPPPGHGETNAGNRAARQMCSLLAGALKPIVGDQVARYDESFNPRAFGDLMARWGTGVVLIESGGELADPDKGRLRRVNYVAILTALEAIATSAWEQYGPEHYLDLPLNSPWIYDLLIRGASIVLPGRDPVRADIAVNFEDTLASVGGTVVEVGDLDEVAALDEIDASGLYFVPDPAALSSEHGGHLQIGDAATGVLARDPEGQQVVMELREGKIIGRDR